MLLRCAQQLLLALTVRTCNAAIHKIVRTHGRSEDDPRAVKDAPQEAQPAGRGDVSSIESDRLFLQCVDDALSVFGPSVKKLVYYYLEKNHGLAPRQIPLELEQFHRSLSAIFGQGASVVEHLILKEVRRKTGSTRAVGEGEFVDEAQRMLNKMRGISKNLPPEEGRVP